MLSVHRIDYLQLRRLSLALVRARRLISRLVRSTAFDASDLHLIASALVGASRAHPPSRSCGHVRLEGHGSWTHPVKTRSVAP